MVYLDHNASTPLAPEVAEALAHAFCVPGPANPSSVHAPGRAARARRDGARARVARVLGCEPREVVFTASGTEADALALKGSFLGRPSPGRTRVVTSQLEHPAVLFAARQLQAHGAQLTEVPPRPDGQVPAEAVLEQLGPDVALCSLMWANNETGVLQPVAEVARACRAAGILFHTDAVQAVGKVDVSLRQVDADLLSLSAHKFGGPPGAGVLVVRRGVKLEALSPGHQEAGRRGGTPSVALAEALALALEVAQANVGEAAGRMAALRNRLEHAVLERASGARVNGTAARVPNTTNLRFEGIDAETLLIALDLDGICVSTGAACASGTLQASHVLTAMGLSPKQARSSVRVSLGPRTTPEEVDVAVAALVRHVTRLALGAAAA
ncbi:MAG: cysteine desulfurase family protein [Myxococcaceae bacterium]